MPPVLAALPAIAGVVGAGAAATGVGLQVDAASKAAAEADRVRKARAQALTTPTQLLGQDYLQKVHAQNMQNDLGAVNPKSATTAPAVGQPSGAAGAPPGTRIGKLVGDEEE